MSREAQNPQMYIWAHQKRSKSGLVSGPWEQTSLNIEFQWPRSCVHPFASLQLTPLPEMSDCQGQSNLKQRSKQLILLLSTSSFLQILKLRGHTKPVEDIINSENEDTTDGQATIGYLLAQARDCLHLFYIHSSNAVHLAQPSALMQALDLQRGAAVDADAKKGRVCYPVMQFRGLLRETATGQHVLGKGLLIVGEAGDCHF